MKFHYDLTQAEPIVRDVPVYAAASINTGEGLYAAIGSSTTKAIFITAGGAGSAAFVKGLGISNETATTTSKADFGDRISAAATTTTDAIASIANTVATGARYAKAIINPSAVYLAEYDQSSAAYCTSAAVSASVTYTQTVEQYMDGGWLYCVPGVTGAVAANEGQLRYLSVSSGTSYYTFLQAATLTAAERVITLYPVNHRITGVNAAAQETKLSRLTSMAAGAGLGLHVMENYVGGKNKPLEPMRMQVHDNLTDKTLKFYADVTLIDHVYNSLS